MALLSCNNAAFAYDGRRVASNLNFTVEPGDYLCIVGENGAGKSTLVKGLLGFIRPCEGSIVTGSGLRVNEIGYLPQQTDVQRDFPASVYEVVLSGCLNSLGMRPFYTKDDRERAEAMMDRLGITALKKSCYRELSGGQQRRALLARALCATRKLILLDEPTTGLDPLATMEMYHLIKDINHHDGITVIMVSHDIAAAVRYGKHILHLSSKGPYWAAAAEYRSSPLGRAFLGEADHGVS